MPRSKVNNPRRGLRPTRDGRLKGESEVSVVSKSSRDRNLAVAKLIEEWLAEDDKEIDMAWSELAGLLKVVHK